MGEEVRLVSQPSRGHTCNLDAVEQTALREKWPSWSVVECQECGTHWYWMEHESRRAEYFYRIGWWNQWRVDWHNR
jgi:hypothetical protein